MKSSNTNVELLFLMMLVEKHFKPANVYSHTLSSTTHAPLFLLQSLPSA